MQYSFFNVCGIIQNMEKDLTLFKNKLEKEVAILEGDLLSVGRKTEENGDDWQAKAPEADAPSYDMNEKADLVETLEETIATETELEIRLNDVKQALGKIEDGSYGTCEVCGEEIEENRLMANPAAKTCSVHMNG